MGWKNLKNSHKNIEYKIHLVYNNNKQKLKFENGVSR